MFAPQCRGCGVSFEAHEASGRLLYPVILPLVVMLVLAAVRFDDAVHQPLWLHALIWPPVVAVVIIGALRLAKMAWLRHAIPDPRRSGED